MQLEALFNAVPKRLPIYVAPADDEALDSWIERTAAANSLTRPQMTRLLVGANREATTAFLTTKPDPRIVERLSGLTGETPEEIYRHTLMRFDGGLPLYLDKLDPRRHHTLREVQPQGWFPGRTTQACPRCLAEYGYWRIQWRLPHLAICPGHGCYLIANCDSCGRGLRDNGGRALKGYLADPQKCGNPANSKVQCPELLGRSSPRQALKDEWRAAIEVGRWILEQPEDSPKRVDQFRDLKSIAGLLCHIVVASRATFSSGWACDFLRLEASISGRQNRRWNMSPPRQANIRAGLVALAIEVARDKRAMITWLSMIPECWEGRRAWIRDHTISSRATNYLISCLD